MVRPFAGAGGRAPRTLAPGPAATRVRAELVAGASRPTGLVAAGFGSTRPIADNATPEGRALNRRIDVVIV